MSFQGAALPLSNDTVEKTAKALGIEVAALRAFMEVEAPKGPFDAKGRPTMLFEPHKFYKHLPTSDKRARAVAEGLAYPRQGTKPYPSESYTRLLQAIEIDLEAALQSCSWGSTQIMGENYEELGYVSAKAMVIAAMDSADLQLVQTAKLMRAKPGLVNAIKKHDWATCARLWNGAGYAKNKYDVKLAKAYQKWLKKAPARPVAVVTDLSKEEIEAVQAQLKKRGYHLVGKVDGKWGSNTIGAISAFQTENGLPLTCKLDPATREELFGSNAPRPIGEARSKAGFADVQGLGIAKIAGGIGLGGSGLSAASEYLDKANEVKDKVVSAWDILEPIRGIVAAHPLLLVTVAGLAVASVAGVFIYAQIRNYRSGALA
ncbi:MULTISPECIES: N-acetylmuramidase domain-containing protein [unclassified Beijerinckia]|uniref:N-acetylmuramidase domain-containing protein n=1 Tax=unclassified Beijerinckia TaxID=2638183 RepID=UPI000B8A0577|nr:MULTISPECIES: N-acetylmuramidase domain-containing protein [unclassified Beijerinckia]